MFHVINIIYYCKDYVRMKRLEHTISVIGLAETNTDPTDKFIFALDDCTKFLSRYKLSKT